MEYSKEPESFAVCEGDPNENTIGLTFVTMERIMKLDNWPDTLALYVFYCWKCRQEGNTSVRATVKFTQGKTGWGERKVQNEKKRLLDLGLIENIQRRSKDERRWGLSYVKVKYLLKSSGVQEMRTLTKRGPTDDAPILDTSTVGLVTENNSPVPPKPKKSASCYLPHQPSPSTPQPAPASPEAPASHILPAKTEGDAEALKTPSPKRFSTKIAKDAHRTMLIRKLAAGEHITEEEWEMNEAPVIREERLNDAAEAVS